MEVNSGAFTAMTCAASFSDSFFGPASVFANSLYAPSVRFDHRRPLTFETGNKEILALDSFANASLP